MSDPSDDPDEATLWAGRLRPWPAADPAPAEEVDTDPVDPDEIEGETRIGRRSAPPDETVVSRRPEREVQADDLVEPDDGTVATRRAHAAPPVASGIAPADRTEVRPTTRREASGRIAAPADTPRNARVPGGHSREIYRPRVADPVIVPRAVPAPMPSATPAPDHDAARRRARARRVRMRVLCAVVVLIAGAAAVGVVVLLTI